MGGWQAGNETQASARGQKRRGPEKGKKKRNRGRNERTLCLVLGFLIIFLVCEDYGFFCVFLAEDREEDGKEKSGWTKTRSRRHLLNKKFDPPTTTTTSPSQNPFPDKTSLYGFHNPKPMIHGNVDVTRTSDAAKAPHQRKASLPI